VTNAPKKSKAATGRKPKAAAEPKPEAAKPEVEVLAALGTEDAPPSRITQTHSAQEWFAVSGVRLGQRPWVVRAAVEGLPEEKRYTEYEIRSLIQRKLSEPA